MFTIVTATNTYTVLTSHVLMCECSLYSSLYETFHSHWLGVVDWIDTPPHPKFICWSLICNMLVQRGEAFGNYWGHQGGAQISRISALQASLGSRLLCSLSLPFSLFFFLQCEHTERRRPSTTRTQPSWCAYLWLHSLQNCEKMNVRYWSHPGYGILL